MIGTGPGGNESDVVAIIDLRPCGTAAHTEISKWLLIAASGITSRFTEDESLSVI